MRPQHPGGWPSDDDEEYECIDLTNSPDPPKRPPPPLHRLPQHQHLARAAEMSPGPARPRPVETVPPTIHPDHLRHIIQTSDATAVRTVLLNLCKLSPALSGAVARGLAPSSSYAQETIKAYRNRSAAPNIKSDPGKTAKHIPPYTNKIPPSTPHQPRIKHEVKTVSISSDDDKDDDDNDDLFNFDEFFKPTPRSSLAGPSSSRGHGASTAVKSEWSNPSQLPLRHTAQTVAQGRTPPASIKTEPALRGPKCRHCCERFENEEEVCVYHPGRRVVATDDYGARVSVYNCCRKPVHESGCVTGTHVAEPVVGLNQWTGRPPTSHDREPKRPRLV